MGKCWWRIVIVSLASLCGWACGQPAALDEDRVELFGSRNQQGELIAIITLDGSVPEGGAPLREGFDGTRSKSTSPGTWVAAYTWDFGDGSPTSSGGWVAHTYPSPGEYVAKLTVTDNKGQTATTTLGIHVVPPEPPIAVIRTDGSQSFGKAPFTANLDGTLSRGANANRWITSYSWDFGDGSPISNKGWNAHTYANPGVYKATLTVTDDRGQTGTRTIDIRACAPAGCNDVPGTVKWAHSVGTQYHDSETSLTATPDGNFVMTYEYRIPGTNATERYISSIDKYQITGQLLWHLELAATPIPSSPSTGVNLLRAFNGPGNELWVTGYLRGQLVIGGTTLSNTRFLLKLSPNGTVLSAAPTPQQGGTMFVDGQSNVINVESDVIHKYDSGGHLLWSQSVPGRTITASALDSEGNLLIGVTQQLPNFVLEYSIAKIGGDGRVLWTNSINTGATFVSVEQILIRPDDGFVARVQSVAEIRWASRVYDAGSRLSVILVGSKWGREEWGAAPAEPVGSLGLDAEGGVYTLGMPKQYDTVVTAYSPVGGRLWSRHLPVWIPLTAAHGDSLLMVGKFGTPSTIDLGTGPLTSQGGEDLAFFDMTR